MRQDEHMLNIGGLHEGVVLDHIPSGKAMDIYKRLKLDKLDCQVAMIMHARSNKMGEKDIINLTTAILVWTIAALGVLVGIGLRVEAILAAVVVYFVLRIRRRRETNHNNQAEEKEHV